MSKPTYLTFPIVLLKDGINNIKECMINSIDYCFYDQFIRLQKSHSYDPVNDAMDKLGIDFNNVQKALKKGKILYDSIDNKLAKTSIRKGMIFDFFSNKKSEYDVVCFLAFASLKSIIQKQGYKKITNDYLLSRMSGNSKNSKDINPLLKKYSTRYQLDKIKTELQLNWGLKYYADKSRGFYVSFTMPLNALALIAERNNKMYKLKLLKNKKKEAMEKAKEQIMKEQNNFSDYS
jgi:hypothetical protein